jgi:hypothetical protein
MKRSSTLPIVFAFGVAHVGAARAEGTLPSMVTPISVSVEAVIDRFSYVIHGFEIRLPMCSWPSMPEGVKCRLTPWYPKIDCLPRSQGDPQQPTSAATYFVMSPASYESASISWLDGTALYSVGDITCPYPGVSDASLGAEVSNARGPDGTSSTSQQKAAGVPVARITGFVNHIDNALVRGTVKLRKTTTPAWTRYQKVQLVIQVAGDDEAWTDVEVVDVLPGTAPATYEVETVVPPNSDVRFEVRILSPDAKTIYLVLQDVRLFGAQCYPDASQPGVCLE